MTLDEAREKIIQDYDTKKVNKHFLFECPFCSKHKLYMNVDTLAFDCKVCGENGSINTFFKKTGENIFVEFERKEVSKEKKFVPLEFKVKDYLTLKTEDERVDKILQFFLSRGISKETVLSCQRIFSHINGSISFFTTDDKEIIYNITYRSLDKRFGMETGSKQMLFNREELSEELGYIYITEGHIDCLTLKEIGIKNVVSMPNGAQSMDWIDNEYDLLEKFDKFILLYDNDKAGQLGLEKAIERLKFGQIFTISYDNYKDINEFYMQDSKRLKEVLEKPNPMLLQGVKGISKVENKVSQIFSSGIKQLDYIFNGFRNKEVTIISAEAGSGKTTLINNLIAKDIEMGRKVFSYSGELSEESQKLWLYTVIAGRGCFEYEDNPFRVGDKIVKLNKEVEEKIDKWVDGKVFINYGGIANAFDLIDRMEYMYRRNAVDTFYIDNKAMMSFIIKGTSNKYEGESEFIKRLASFLQTNEVRVFLVVHPTKTIERESNADFRNKSGTVKNPCRLSLQDVSGSSDLTNLAHNVLAMHKANEHWREFIKQKCDGCSDLDKTKAVLYLLKNRVGGKTQEDLPLAFDDLSKRFYSVYEDELLRHKYNFEVKELPTEEEIKKFMEEFADD